ncbi:MAG: COQ9 family protein [Maricaulaceae bacterium]
MDDLSHQARQSLLDAALPIAAFEGWTQKTLRDAAAKVGLPKGAEALYFPEGPLELLKFWADGCDQHVEQVLSELDQSSMKIRDKVTAGIMARLEAIGRHDLAAKRAAARLALPDGAGQAAAQSWAAADTIWRAIDDTSTDANYYSKRTILSGVIASSLLAWIADNDPEKPKGRAFVEARIANVMQFETFKWNMKARTKDWPNPVNLLGKLRYGTGFKRRRKCSSDISQPY